MPPRDYRQVLAPKLHWYGAGVRCALDASPLLGARTGVATFTAGLLEGLDGKADISAYALSWRGRSLLREVLPAGVTSGWAVPAGPLLRVWARTNLVSAERILDLVDDVDVVHGTNFVVPPTRSAGRICTVHDLTAVRFPEMCTPTSRRYPTLVRRAIAGGAWIHTPSAFVAAEVCEAFGADPARVRAIPHGVTQTNGDPEAGRKLAVALTGCERYILSLATVEPRKDLALLVRAFDDLAGDDGDIGLVLAGGPGWGSIDEVVDAAFHRDRVGRPGYVSDEDRGALLAGAAAFAFPSRYEGFGLPPLEAMAAGVPVVASDAGAVREVCGDAATLVAVGDTDGFAAALAAALAHPETAKGRARVAPLTWDRCGDRMLALYGDAVADRG